MVRLVSWEKAGPEAIMPLKRGANGKLGVQMEGGGGDTINVVQNLASKLMVTTALRRSLLRLHLR